MLFIKISGIHKGLESSCRRAGLRGSTAELQNVNCVTGVASDQPAAPQVESAARRLRALKRAIYLQSTLVYLNRSKVGSQTRQLEPGNCSGSDGLDEQVIDAGPR
jgi:hypothetical protein